MNFIIKPLGKIFKKGDKNKQQQSQNYNQQQQQQNPSIYMQKIVPDFQQNTNKQTEEKQALEEQKKIEKFEQILSQQIIDFDKLKALSYYGVPSQYRDKVWKVLLQYLPTNKSTQEKQLNQKRQQYQDMVQQYFGFQEENEQEEEKNDEEKKMYKQIHNDVKRTMPDSNLFKSDQLYQILVRLLYIWHMRHPACGYVQGINDVATPFIIVFLNKKYQIDLEKQTFVDQSHYDNIDQQYLFEVEADTYFCLSKVLDGVIDNYTEGSPGIKKSFSKVKQIIERLDKQLIEYIEEECIDFYTLYFKWMICLLLRQFNLRVGLCLFDTYLAYENNYKTLSEYLFITIIINYSNEIKAGNFEETMDFLTNIPTVQWQEENLEVAKCYAYSYRETFEKK